MKSITHNNDESDERTEVVMSSIAKKRGLKQYHKPEQVMSRDYQRMFKKACSLKDFEMIVRLAVRDAKDKSSSPSVRHNARTWISDNLIGKPVNRVDDDNPLSALNIYANVSDAQLLKLASGILGKASAPSYESPAAQPIDITPAEPADPPSASQSTEPAPIPLPTVEEVLDGRENPFPQKKLKPKRKPRRKKKPKPLKSVTHKPHQPTGYDLIDDEYADSEPDHDPNTDLSPEEED